MRLFQRLLYQFISSGLRREHSAYIVDEAAFSSARAKILCLVSSIFLVCSFLLNVGEGLTHLLLPISVALTLIVPHFFILRYFQRPHLTLFCVAAVMIVFSMFLLFLPDGADGSYLFWLLLLTPMFMFCMGLTYGSVFFCVLLCVLLTCFFSPLDQYIYTPRDLHFRSRFLASLLGCFLFSWLAEYVRLHTQRALMRTAKMMERHALTDPLTALGNRRDFQNYFLVSQAQSKRSQREFAIAILDIDHFKRVNDTYGHAVGDYVLCHVAALLSAHLRVSDRLFRWGGEEFVLLMPDTGKEEGALIAERLRKLVEQTPYIGERLAIPITISIGLHCGSAEDGIERHIAMADDNLYQAKKMGRNQVRG